MTVEKPQPAFHVMAKPTGSSCNLACKYCFFLAKEKLYPDSSFRMTDELLDEYIRQYLNAPRIPQATVAWQGGEPTMMGLDFFRRSIECEKRYKKPGMTVDNTIQTNATLLDDEWCRFLKENNFLVGISIDGPRELHDANRVDKGGNPTFDRVMQGYELLKKYEVNCNILCTVHAANGDYPLEVYSFFRDELDAEFIQFIAIVERDNESGCQESGEVTDRSVAPEQYGEFLACVFDEWVQLDVGRVFVQIFDVSLANWVGAPPGLCVFAPTCGNALVMEHNGDIYSCDHFVEPDYLLGNIMNTPMTDLVASPAQLKFGQDKLDELPDYCRECEVLFACHGGCPKNRFTETPNGEPGLNYLCEGYKAFFNHVNTPMRLMANLLRQKRLPAEVMRIIEDKEEARLLEAFAKAGRNDPCPCGSGRKYKHCHGQS